jgi:hypothetical protein
MHIENPGNYGSFCCFCGWLTLPFFNFSFCRSHVKIVSSCCVLSHGNHFLHCNLVRNENQAVSILMTETLNRGSRISIIYSVIRIDSRYSRRMLYVAISVVYFLAAVVMIIQLFWVCEPKPSWKEARNPQCPLTTQVAVVQLVSKLLLFLRFFFVLLIWNLCKADILADIFLLVAPLSVLKHLQDKALRKKLILIFSTCLVTTVVSVSKRLACSMVKQ